MTSLPGWSVSPDDEVGTDERFGQLRQTFWICSSCREEFSVDYDRTPETCPTCGSFDVTAEESGW